MRRRLSFASLSSLVTALALTVVALNARSERITTPKEQFGFNLGDDYQLANYTQLTEYWKKLDAESDRMTLDRDRQDRRGPPAADGDRHLAGEPQEAGALQGDRPAARARPRA